MRFALFYEIPVALPWGPDSERLAWRRVAGAVLARPGLWLTALGQVLRLARPGWWHRWPPVPAPDAVVIDTTGMDLGEVVERCYRLARERLRD